MPPAFFELAEHRSPPEQPVGPVGGRPPAGHRTAMSAIWFVPASGCRWGDVPPELGGSGMTAHRCLRRWEETGVGDRPHAGLPRLLRQAGTPDPDLVAGDAATLRAFGGGEKTGPSPADRGRKGTKHTLLVGRRGVPPATRAAGANASGRTRIIPLVLDFPKVGGRPGRPKGPPDELHADRGDDSDDTRRLLRWPGTEPHIAKRRAPRGGGLGKVRRVAERTASWIKGLRRMRVRYDRPGVIQGAWNTPAACVICFRILHDDDHPTE